MFLCNTAFQQPARFITTWVNQKKDAKSGEITSIYNQIDYIIMDKEQAHTLISARSYAGTETYSDHKLVKMEVEINWVKLYRTQKPKTNSKRFDITRLVDDEEVQNNYKNQLNIALTKLRENGKKGWNNIMSTIKEVADETIGFKKKEKHQHVQDKELEQMSKQQMHIRKCMESSNSADKVDELRKSRKNIMKKMKTKVIQIREKEIDKIINEVESSKDDARMFQAVKFLNKKKAENTFVHDKEGKSVTNKQTMYSIINQHFKEHLQKPDIEPIQPFKEHIPKKLNNPITRTEVTKATNKMSNNKAYWDIPVELVKYADVNLHDEIANTLNNIFEEHNDTDLGEGRLIPLQKPKPKPKGPVINLRPITLLNLLRKILSRLTTSRIETSTNTYLSHTQSAYRKGRSTSDVVWAYRWICAKV